MATTRSSERPLKPTDLRGILKYVPMFREHIFVIAIDGSIVEHENFQNLVTDIAVLRSLNINVVIVHGIGKQLRDTAARQRAELSDVYGEGATDAGTMEIACEAAGIVSQAVIEGLTHANLKCAITNAVRATQVGVIGGVDQQLTGKVEKIDTPLLKTLLAQGVIPLVTPILCDRDGNSLRANSDAVAAELAAISDNSSSALVLQQAMPQIQAQYDAYISAGAFDEQFAPILAMILGTPANLSDLYNSGMLEMMIGNANVVDALIALSGAGTLDYLVNVNLGYVGGEYAQFDASATEVGADTALDVTFVKVSASTHAAAMAPISMDSIAYMQGVIDDYVSSTEGITASWVTGTAVIMYDISEIISGEFTMIELLVVVLIIILLFFVMRSYTIPLRSVATILMSIVWTLAATHLLFGDEVTWLIPLILLVICLGLGMDYDILLTTRIKENVRANGMSNDEAIHHAVVHSGSVITICGLIMGGAFGTLMLSSMGMLQQTGRGRSSSEGTPPRSPTMGRRSEKRGGVEPPHLKPFAGPRAVLIPISQQRSP